MNDTLETFMVILCASFLFSLILSRTPWLRIPSSIGYLLFGVLIGGRIVPVTAEETQWLSQLGDFGLLFLMYLSGLEVDLTLLQPSLWRGRKTNPLYLSVSIFCMTMLISFVCAKILVTIGLTPAHPWMLTLLFATTSMGVILPILEETNRLQTAFGQTLLLCALIADLMTMILVSLFVTVRRSGRLEDFVIAIAIIPLALLCYYVLHWLQRFGWVRRFFSDVQSRMRAIVALVAAFCAFAEFTGTEPILGSFLVGMMVSALPFAFKERIKQYSHGVGYGFLIPLFFISVGMGFHFSSFQSADAWMWIGILVCVAFVVKLRPALQLRRHFGTKAAIAGGFLLSARLSLVVAAADLGVSIGALPAFLGGAMMIVATLTCLAAPTIFVTLMDSEAG